MDASDFCYPNPRAGTTLPYQVCSLPITTGNRSIILDELSGVSVTCVCQSNHEPPKDRRDVRD